MRLCILVALGVVAGCKDYGRGVLMTLLAPDRMRRPADELKLRVEGDPGVAFWLPFRDAGDRKLFEGTLRETILYKPLSRTGQLSLFIEVWSAGEEAWAQFADVEVGSGTTTREATLTMGEPPTEIVGDLAAQEHADLTTTSPDIAGTIEDMAKPATTDMAQSADLAGCTDCGGGTCYAHNNGFRDYITCAALTTTQEACEREGGTCAFMGGDTVCKQNGCSEAYRLEATSWFWCNGGRLKYLGCLAADDNKKWR